jgi:hypothetical protein
VRVALAAAVLLVGCSHAPSPGSELPHAEELRSLRAPALAALEGDTLRIVFHDWHRSPGLLTLNCRRSCTLEVRTTDGYGTYQQGTLDRAATVRVAESEARAVMEAVGDRGFWRLLPLLPEGGTYGFRPGGGDMICLHAPYYYLEGRVGERKQLVHRYCQEGYEDGWVAAAPLLEMFRRRFPEEFAAVSNFSEEEIKALLASRVKFADRAEPGQPAAITSFQKP